MGPAAIPCIIDVNAETFGRTMNRFSWNCQFQDKMRAYVLDTPGPTVLFMPRIGTIATVTSRERRDVPNHRNIDCFKSLLKLHQSKHQILVSLALCADITGTWPLHSPGKGPVTRKCFHHGETTSDWWFPSQRQGTRESHLSYDVITEKQSRHGCHDQRYEQNFMLLVSKTGSRLNVKIVFPGMWFQCIHKTVVSSSYLYNGNLITGKTWFYLEMPPTLVYSDRLYKSSLSRLWRFFCCWK